MDVPSADQAGATAADASLATVWAALSSTSSTAISVAPRVRIVKAIRRPSGAQRAGDLYAPERVKGRGLPPSRSLIQSSYCPDRVDWNTRRRPSGEICGWKFHRSLVGLSAAIACDSSSTVGTSRRLISYCQSSYATVPVRLATVG